MTGKIIIACPRSDVCFIANPGETLPQSNITQHGDNTFAREEALTLALIRERLSPTPEEFEPAKNHLRPTGEWGDGVESSPMAGAGRGIPTAEG